MYNKYSEKTPRLFSVYCGLLNCLNYVIGVISSSLVAINSGNRRVAQATFYFPARIAFNGSYTEALSFILTVLGCRRSLGL